MGNFSPSPFYTKEVDDFCKKYIYQATVDAMAAEGRPFTGVIFFGLMLTADGPRGLVHKPPDNRQMRAQRRLPHYLQTGDRSYPIFHPRRLPSHQ